MASIKFFTQTDKYPATIYVRISLDRKNIYKKKTPLSAVESWSKEKGFDKGRDAKGKEINVTLKNLEAFITQQLNVSTSKNDVIDSLWLQNQIDKFFNKSIKNSDGIDYSILNNYLDYFINDKEKVFKHGLIEEGTLKKYKTVKNLLIDFQKYLKKQYRIIDIDRDFKDKFEDYAQDVIIHDTNTTGRNIKFIKEICNHARINKGIETSLDLDLYKGYSVKTPSIYLTFEELDQIEATQFKHDYLDNARDWLIVGCFTGQRISDLLQYSSKDIITIGDVELLQIQQKKTKKNVSIPIHEKVKKILDKRDGYFPRKISDQRFNEYIKEVAKIADIDTLTEGKCFNSETKRKELGTYEKYKIGSVP